MSANGSLAKREQQSWLEQWLPHLRAELEALEPDELIPLTIDVPSAICTVYGVLPKLQLLRDRIADELPRFDLASFDRLELYTQALQKAHGHYLMTVEPQDNYKELLQRGTALREQLLADAKALALRGHLNPAALRNLKTRSGSKSLSVDLLALAQLFRANWPTLAGKSTPETDLNLADQLSVALMRAIGRRQRTQTIAIAAQLRLRTFTLFILTYDNARRAVTYLCGRETDPNSIAPSLYGGRKRRKKEVNGRQGEPTDPSTSTQHRPFG